MAKLEYTLFDGFREHRFRLPADSIVPYHTVATAEPVADAPSLLLKRLQNPIGCATLAEQLTDNMKVLLICDDYTRPTPINLLLPTLLDELNRLRIPDENITILVAAGHHRQMNEQEKIAKYGSQACKRIRIVHHFSDDLENLSNIGKTSTGIDVSVNRLASEADFCIGIGVVEIHPWAGFAGGGKIINPGIAAKKTINQTHALPILSQVGISKTENNPFWITSAESAELLPLNIIINCLLDIDEHLIELAVGNPRQAQLWLIDRFKEVNELIFDEPADVVIASAYPKFQLWPQAAISLYNIARITKPGGVRISLAACPEGLGDCEQEKDFYYRSFTTPHKSPRDYWNNWLGKDCVNSRNTCAVYKLLCDAENSDGILVSPNLPTDMVNQPVFSNLNDALRHAFDKSPVNPKIAVVDKAGMVLASLYSEKYQAQGES